MGQTQKHFIIVAGEASGDLHAAHLVDELKRIDPGLTFSGVGGARMRASGVELYRDMSSLAVVGFLEVLKHYREIREVFNLVLKKMDAVKPQAVILVDYPGFNLRLAKEIKKRGIPVIYYISPQVWAWKANRVRQVAQYVDKMLVFFPFEKEFYAQRGVQVEFVGHPLVDSVRPTMPEIEFMKTHGLVSHRLTIGLLPGSRQNEIHQILPVMLEAADLLHQEFKQTQFIVLKAHTIERTLLEPLCQKASCQPIIIDEQTYDGINASDLCMVASGTATLETAILEKPMVIVYKTSLLTWLLARYLVKIPHIGLVNVVAGKKVVPECVQFEANGKEIAAELKKIFTDEVRISGIKTDLRKVKETLGPGGSAQRCAGIIYSAIILKAQTP
ncbi:MAG: lipid-A-disaccharide synthase, partial [Candidatus Omnitrophica bacterium]|nr:lipid-A-disaccharide synthase [Candidatus Omnitrophota bacterium]